MGVEAVSKVRVGTGGGEALLALRRLELALCLFDGDPLECAVDGSAVPLSRLSLVERRGEGVCDGMSIELRCPSRISPAGWQNALVWLECLLWFGVVEGFAEGGLEWGLGVESNMAWLGIGAGEFHRPCSSMDAREKYLYRASLKKNGGLGLGLAGRGTTESQTLDPMQRAKASVAQGWGMAEGRGTREYTEAACQTASTF